MWRFSFDEGSSRDCNLLRHHRTMPPDAHPHNTRACHYDTSWIWKQGTHQRVKCCGSLCFIQWSQAVSHICFGWSNQKEWRHLYTHWPQWNDLCCNWQFRSKWGDSGWKADDSCDGHSHIQMRSDYNRRPSSCQDSTEVPFCLEQLWCRWRSLVN